MTPTPTPTPNQYQKYLYERTDEQEDKRPNREEANSRGSSSRDIWEDLCSMLPSFRSIDDSGLWSVVSGQWSV